ncbi:hypothetical protein ACFOD8_09970 [Arthrobacter agilis]|uniref:hypothetical protein n=1 Tax=Arthrobacter agilis TaxID=37921 RepID=UPI000B556471|nr:hypothetical protein [Arthrobacter agilis]OUM41413.1 hypothetical protein B8W74_10950 [Arthrobacter agilis]
MAASEGARHVQSDEVWECVNLNGVDRRDIDDAATLMTVLRHSKHPSSIRSILSGWDMLQVDVPSREQVETAISILVGSGLAEVDSSWGMRITEQGGQLRRSVKGSQGMRSIPIAMSDLLAGCELSRAPLALPQSVYGPAREDYFDAARRREERQSRHRWWWPDPFRRPRQ